MFGMVPFNISCTCYLFTIIKNEKILKIYAELKAEKESYKYIELKSK